MLAQTQVIHHDAERKLYTWGALVAMAVVLIGFAQSYFLKIHFGTPALSALLHAHGGLMTLWFLFFLMQARLVAMGRTDLHRRTGVAGAFLALAVVIVGTATAITAAKLGRTPGPPPLVFLSIPLGDIVVFALLVGAGLYFRKRSDVHKRLMLLSCVGMLSAAFARFPLEFIQTGGPLAFFALTDLVVLACVAYDTLQHRRLHPAFGWGVLLIIASQPLRLLFAGTALWLQFAQWVTQ